jgi:predicted membrane protein
VKKMPLLFLIPLFTGLVTGYIFKNSTDEIGQIIGVVAAISLVLSLILAPWQVQLLLLVVVLVSTKKLLQQNEYKLKQQEKDQEQLNNGHNQEVISSPVAKIENEVTRKYRGNNYQATDVNVEIQEGEIVGRYRGLPWRMHQVVNTPRSME